jgi:hypothetical protein
MINYDTDEANDTDDDDESRQNIKKVGNRPIIREKGMQG